jgi:predicted GH43/DUF377 family glycosyl hydrolase
MITKLRVTDTGIALHPDRTRVISRLFVPGREDVGPGDSRASPVIGRILELEEFDVEAAMLDIDERFSHRHRGLHDIFTENAALVMPRIEPDVAISPARLLLLGASFTHEYAIEGAALCNPSAVLHPRQDTNGDAAFILSVRGVGEGHRSSIGFRTGSVTSTGIVTVDPPGPFPVTAPAKPSVNHRAVFHAKLAQLDDDYENAAFVLDALPEQFNDAQLDARMELLAADEATRRHTAMTIAHLRSIARHSYTAEFPASSEVSERVLWPQAPAERIGMEDARFVRFIGESGDVTYYATYTAFDGLHVTQHLLETTDFITFEASPVAGESAIGKGLALFPRMIDGSYVALSRFDRETNAIAFSDDVRCWNNAQTIQIPDRGWEILQLGNCGSPIETESGWLVLTHGVGPMRTYSLGALLLDIDEPQRVLARSDGPIISPSDDRRDGYVPNVVYSCGAFAHGDILMIPYGVADQGICIATLSIKELLATMRPAV